MWCFPAPCAGLVAPMDNGDNTDGTDELLEGIAERLFRALTLEAASTGRSEAKELLATFCRDIRSESRYRLSRFESASKEQESLTSSRSCGVNENSTAISIKTLKDKER